MPAASWRIMPARSISRSETISASFGVSRRIGRKKRERRMEEGRFEHSCAGGRVKADRAAKYNPACGGAGGSLDIPPTRLFSPRHIIAPRKQFFLPNCV